MKRLENITVFSENNIFSASLTIDGKTAGFEKFDFQNGETISSSIHKYCLFPGFTDVHVHFREPGFSYKETIASGSAAAAAGGYTRVCTMPNLDPVPDNLNNLNRQLEIIKKDSLVEIIPFGSITKGEKGKDLSEMEELAPYVAGFSDDGCGINSDQTMLEAMAVASKLCKIISAHCEDTTLSSAGVIAECRFAAMNDLPVISSESEYTQIKRDIELSKKTKCSYHVCHVSTKESVSLIRNAKKDGVDITCETAPHYLLLASNDISDDGKYKMKPPLRSLEDREALTEGLKDNTIDMIATDHAPHSYEEKAGKLSKSAFGITGLEVAFPLLYSSLVLKGVISLPKLISLLSYNADKRFFPNKPKDINNNFCVFDLDEAYRIDPDKFYSKGKSTPFEGTNVYGKCKLTVLNGQIIYSDGTL